MKKRFLCIFLILCIAFTSVFALGIELTDSIGLTDGNFTQIGVTYGKGKLGFATGLLISSYTIEQYGETEELGISAYQKLYGDWLFVNKEKFNFGLEFAASIFLGINGIYADEVTFGAIPEIDVKFGFINHIDVLVGFSLLCGMNYYDVAYPCICLGARYNFNKKTTTTTAKPTLHESKGNVTSNDASSRTIFIDSDFTSVSN